MGLADGNGASLEGMESEPTVAAPDDQGGAQNNGDGNDGSGHEEIVTTPEAPRTERVTLNRKGRAQAAQNELSKQISSLQETFTKRDEDYSRRLAERDAQIARLQGSLETIVPIMQRSQEGRAQQGPTPESLMAEAEKALDNKDISTYQKKFAEAVKLQVLSEVPRPQAPQQQEPPFVMAMRAQHPAVAMKGPEGDRLVIAIAEQLGVTENMPPGPDRLKLAFSMAEKALAKKPGAQFSTSQQNRDALSGVPTTRGNGGAGGNKGPGVELTATELRWADAAGMSKEEYAKYLVEGHPERLEK